ncbi:MAG: tetratricopeptide repeat protein [Bacteroidota bacterium]
MSGNEDQYWDKIDDFLDGQLPQEERQAFEVQLNQEEQLRKDLAFQHQLRQGIAFGSQGPLRARLDQIQAEYQAGEGQANKGTVVPIGRGLMNRWMLAAGLLIGALTILFLIQQPANNSNIYASNYEPYTLKNTTRSPGQGDLTSLAVEAYQAGNYEGAATRLEDALAAAPDQAPLQLALAISYWENGAQEDAQAALLPLLDHPLLQDQANWYAALFDLATDDIAAARAHLEVVAAAGGGLGAKAEKLLSQTK